MTDSNPVPKHRSAFVKVMLIAVGLVIVAGVVFVFVPLVECNACFGVGALADQEYQQCIRETSPESEIDVATELEFELTQGPFHCSWCSQAGVVSAYHRWVDYYPQSGDRGYEFKRVRAWRASKQ